jgi:hypothetical protein
VAIDLEGITLELVGTLDRMRAVGVAREVWDPEAGDLVTLLDEQLIDLKSGRRVVKLNKLGDRVASTAVHKPQLGTYEILYSMRTGRKLTRPPAILGASTEGLGFALTEAPGARQMMIGTEDEPGLMSIGARMFKNGIFPPNPRSPMCSERYCARWQTCIYHD